MEPTGHAKASSSQQCRHFLLSGEATTVAARARIDDFEVEDHSSGDSGGTIIEKECPEPDGDSQEGDGGSEWDEMSVMETFAR